MSKRRAGTKGQPFPLRRPEIIIKPSRARPFAVDCKEVPGWFAVPKVGDHTLWAIYDPPDWRLTEVTDMRTVRPARIHEVDCVQMDVDSWEPDKGWTPMAWLMFARAGEETVQWLANLRIVDGKRRLYTFLDEGFDQDWGDWPRRLEDIGRLVRQEDGSHKLKKPRTERVQDTLGAGIFHVKVADRGFTCLRLLDLDHPPSEEGILYESYITRRGRSMLGRRYNGRLWHIGPDRPPQRRTPWDERFPDHDRMVINGVTYVHWYDCLSHIACGIEPRSASAGT